MPHLLRRRPANLIPEALTPGGMSALLQSAKPLRLGFVAHDDMPSVDQIFRDRVVQLAAAASVLSLGFWVGRGEVGSLRRCVCP